MDGDQPRSAGGREGPQDPHEAAPRGADKRRDRVRPGPYGSLAASAPDGEIDGLPYEVLAPWAERTVDLGCLRGSRRLTRSRQRTCRVRPDPRWHGVASDVNFARMMLIPIEIHEQIRHWGGVSIWKAITGSPYR
ncbi:hypothetical protein E4K10_47930 [Streptomyces sp. T1317-0309]|nr:hypothetical protein E4K10_47930 [Streptomyces sp. T1317-0309]